MLRLEPRGQRSRLWTYASPLLALALTIITSAVIFSVLGKDPLQALYVFLISPLTSWNQISELLVKAGPLIMIGVGLSFGFRANVWNIGAEGQYTLGAILASVVGLSYPDVPALVLIPAMMIAGVMGGMLWAAVPAYLKTQWNANEILTSLMLTYVAQLLLIFLVTGPMRDPDGYGFPGSAPFSSNATSPLFFDQYRVHLGVLVALVTAVIGWLVMTRTVIGFQLRVLGLAPRAARFAGFTQDRLIWLSLMIGGGLAGLAGMFEVAGPIGLLNLNISPGYGFTAIIVAFLGRLHPIGVMFGGLILAITYLGGDAAQMELQMPNAVGGIFRGVLLFFLLACDVLILYRLRGAQPRVAGGA